MLPVTILTPTFNRKHTLNRVYKSLLKQDYMLFEWLLIDDGSTDLTKDLIKELKEKAPFKIRYRYQKNGGKHRAHNTGVLIAGGILTIILDSDDTLVEGAIRIIWDSWDSISENEKKKLCWSLG